MKYVVSIEDSIYLLWQAEILIWNFLELGILHDLCVVITYRTETPSDYARHLTTLADVKLFKSQLTDFSYSPTNKLHGVRLLLERFPDYGRELLLMDSDLVFREKLDLSVLLPGDSWYFSDCSSYLNYNYVSQHLTDGEITEVLGLCGLTPGRFREATLGGGAQMLFKNVDSAFFLKCELDAPVIYRWLQEKAADGKNKIQIWTAEMWAILWNGLEKAEILTHSELDFSWATDSLEIYQARKILHFAGVTGDLRSQGYFDKTAFTNSKPWYADLSGVTATHTASSIYPQLFVRYKNVLS